LISQKVDTSRTSNILVSSSELLSQSSKKQNDYQQTFNKYNNQYSLMEENKSQGSNSSHLKSHEIAFQKEMDSYHKILQGQTLPLHA
jgi:hypothetical protein